MVKSIRVIILLFSAYYIFPKGKLNEVTPFVRAMPDEYKLDDKH
jgi:hypothetical protein